MVSLEGLDSGLRCTCGLRGMKQQPSQGNAYMQTAIGQMQEHNDACLPAYGCVLGDLPSGLDEHLKNPGTQVPFSVMPALKLELRIGRSRWMYHS
jgi:hypothetical protein